MRPDRGNAAELPIHAQGQIFLVGADRPLNRSSRGPSAPWHGIPSEAADVDHGQFVGRRLKDCPVVVDLHELSPVGGWPAGGRHGRRLERFAEVCQDLPNRPWLDDERDQPDVATTPRARKRKLLAHPSHEFGLWRREVSWERGLPHESQP